MQDIYDSDDYNYYDDEEGAVMEPVESVEPMRRPVVIHRDRSNGASSRPCCERGSGRPQGAQQGRTSVSLDDRAGFAHSFCSG